MILLNGESLNPKDKYMATKQRIEDLGRIAEKLSNITDNGLFQLYHQRPKDFLDWFQAQEKEKQSNLLHELAYRISQVEEEIHECYQIARWGDDEE